MHRLNLLAAAVTAVTSANAASASALSFTGN
jgi:hypothetical protein